MIEQFAPDKIFFDIFEDILSNHKLKIEAYEAAELIFEQKTAMAFGVAYRKYNCFESFQAAYYRYLKNKIK